MVNHDACEVTGLSDPGCVRVVNEDALSLVPELGLVTVADGMGGHNGGSRAARIAVEVVERKLRRALSEAGEAASEAGLAKALASAHRRIRAAAKADHALEGMGATVACLLYRDRTAFIAHVGDTRVYRLRAGKLQLLTRDHAMGRYLHESGAQDAVEAAASHNRHLVTSALGVGEECPVETQCIPVEAGDLFLVCSDGLSDMVDGVDIELVLDTMQGRLGLAVDQLVMIARDCGGFDNVSVALLRAGPGTEQVGAAPNGSVSFLARVRGWLGLRG